MNTVLTETSAAAAICATVTASKPSRMKRPVATSEIVVRVRAFFHARRPAGGTPASCTEEEDAMTRTLHPLQNSVERVTLGA